MCVVFFCLVHICILLSFVGSFLSWGHFGRNNWSRSLFLTRLVPLFPQRTDCSGTIVHVTLDWELTYGSHRDFHFMVETSSRNTLSPKFTIRRGSKFCVLGQKQLRNVGDTSIIPPSRKLCWRISCIHESWAFGPLFWFGQDSWDIFPQRKTQPSKKVYLNVSMWIMGWLWHWWWWTALSHWSN